MDLLTGAAFLAKPILGGISSLLSKKKAKQAPNPANYFTPLPPPPPDPMSSGFAQGISSQLQGNSMLPESYRQAILNQSSRNLGIQRDQSMAAASERLNKMNLLGSGALGVQHGMIDQGFMRGMADVQDSLNQQDLAERARLQSLLANIASQGTQQAQRQYEIGVDAQMKRQMMAYQAALQQSQGEGAASSSFLENLGDLFPAAYGARQATRGAPNEYEQLGRILKSFIGGV